ncbi:MAG: cytidylate kinase-like family protein [Bacteroidales bacterium]|jgi:cytidylate kinase|nr:cytidylate kinase-like family protein [Bacteroidales bacterium]MDX9925964.1 cytidylate kinase-like family protein [Bacteroidales bacterium]HNX83207.1 cytidylate kinase-like family protein [Bacteroidales bacterium]HOC47420.1 cytidylate kinase-like family protein [Bacteroidales bacterium]HPS96696.1 cytidylate kinase-like family protein [Bacteroidales bacterium]
MVNRYIITIGRQLGSGGREIGQKLSARLGIAFYDKELIRIASQQSGLKEEFFERVDEQKHFSLFPGILGLRTSLTDDFFSNYYLSNESLFRIQSDVMRTLAGEGSCIFVGRCADYVMKDERNCLNLFISADMADRIKRIAISHKLSDTKAKELIERTDKGRSSYYNYFSGKTWGAAESYHLCINSSVLGIDETVRLISHVAGSRFGLTENRE